MKRVLTGPVAPSSHPLDAIGSPAEGPASVDASLAADASTAQAGAPAGPGTLRWAIDRWRAAHPGLVSVLPCVEPVAVLPVGPMHTVEAPIGVRIAATRIGVEVTEYFHRQHRSERWCPRCEAWQLDWRHRAKRVPYCPACWKKYMAARYQQRKHWQADAGSAS
jgi:hypothetical protein